MKKKLFIFIIMFLIMPTVTLAISKSCYFQDANRAKYELVITPDSAYIKDSITGLIVADGSKKDYSTDCPESVNICTYSSKNFSFEPYSKVTPNECDPESKYTETTSIKLTTYVDKTDHCVYTDSNGARYSVDVSDNSAYGNSGINNYTVDYEEFENGCPDTAYLCTNNDGISSGHITTGSCQNGFTSTTLTKKSERNPRNESQGGEGEEEYIERVSCKTLFGDPNNSNEIAYWLQWAMKLIKYAGIIALFAMSTADFVKALISNDQDALKKAGTTTIKRFIYCVLLFFLPIIVDALMTLVGAYGTCNIG